MLFQTCDIGQVYNNDLGSCTDTEFVEACNNVGDGYCPEIECQMGTSEPYDINECTEVYCTCSDEGVLVEEVTY